MPSANPVRPNDDTEPLTMEVPVSEVKSVPAEEEPRDASTGAEPEDREEETQEETD